VITALQDSDNGCPPHTWEQVTGLGWLGLVIPIEYGGAAIADGRGGACSKSSGAVRCRTVSSARAYSGP